MENNPLSLHIIYFIDKEMMINTSTHTRTRNLFISLYLLYPPSLPLSFHPPLSVYGSDYLGGTCGTDQPGKFIVYPNVIQDYIANYGKTDITKYKFYGICVSSCPAAMSAVCNYDTPEYPFSQLNSTAVDDCLNYGNMSDLTTSSSGLTIPCGIVKSSCWITPITTESLAYRCIPQIVSETHSNVFCAYPKQIDDPSSPLCLVKSTNSTGLVSAAAQPNKIFDALNNARSKFSRYFGDLARAWWVILICALGVSFAVGIIFVHFLKCFTPCFVWSIIIGSNLILIALTIYFYSLAGLISLTDISPALVSVVGSSVANSTVAALGYSVSSLLSTTDYSYIAYVSTGVTIIVFCITIALIKSVVMAIEVVKLGCDGLNSNPALIFFPLTNVITYGAFAMWWLFVVALLATSGNKSISGSMKSELSTGLEAMGYQSDYIGSFVNSSYVSSSNSTLTTIVSSNELNYALIYMFFGLLWIVNWLSGMYTVTVAGAVCAWYFSSMPAEVEADPKLAALKYDIKRFSLCRSCWRSVRYHSGSVGIGSLLMALVGFIRPALYFSRQFNGVGKENSAMKFFHCCVNSCLVCIEKCVQILTKNAYIVIALKGQGFCSAGASVFGLIIAHTGVFAVVGVLSELLMLLGKVTIACISAWIGYLILNTATEFKAGGTNEVQATWMVTLVILFFSFFVGSGFMDVLSLTVDTVLVCYCTDIDENQARNNNNAAFAVPIHMRADKLAFQRRIELRAAGKNAGTAATAGAAKGGPIPVLSSKGGVGGV